MVKKNLLALLALASTALASTCNGDNCLNALKAKGSDGISFCNTYTSYAPTQRPTATFVPATCGPQRVSSACYCDDNVANPTYTPAPCPTGQVLQNPSFFRARGYDPDIRPWVIAVPTGAPGCVPVDGSDLSYQNLNWGDERAM